MKHFRSPSRSIRHLVPILAALAGAAFAFPPAPHHNVFGTVRNERGHPLSSDALVIMSARGGEIYRGKIGPSTIPGANYVLKIPMDTGRFAELYRPTAMEPNVAFTMTVLVGATQYVPIEVQGDPPRIGAPAQSTRLDLTLGVDSDRDGLPDRWEEDLIASSLEDDLDILEDVRPEDDFDRDGLSNLAEYIAGTYAFDQKDGLNMEVVGKVDGFVHLRFLSITGRTYQLKASPDGKAFSPVTFSLTTSGPASLSALRAREVRYQDVYVPAGDGPNQLFRLYVQ